MGNRRDECNPTHMSLSPAYTYPPLINTYRLNLLYDREFDEMIAQKMAQLEEQKELAARRKLELENRRIKEMRAKPVEEGGM